MDLSFAEFGAIFAMQGFNGLSVFCVLLLMALGLAIIFGQMGVINMAHGEFLTIGAYTTFFISTLTESFFPQLLPYYFLIAIIAAFLTAGIIGYMVERLMISRLYQRPLDTLLATWGLSLIMQQLFRSIFGPKEVSPTLPDWLMGSYQPTEAIDIPINGLFLVASLVSQINFNHFWIILHIVHFACCQNFALVQYRDFVSNGFDEFHVMFNHQHRTSFADFP